MKKEKRTLHGMRVSTVDIFEKIVPINIGNIDYYGDPQLTISNHSGTGQIRKR